MKFSNEIKVGLTIIAAVVVFIFGVRYFENLPLFTSTYDLVAEFDDAGGLISGNIVRVRGVTVGSVNAVFIHPETGRVRVHFHVNREILITEGAYASVAGFDALGVVRLDLFLGDPAAPLIAEGGMVDGHAAEDLFASLSARAPGIVDQVDKVLAGLETVLEETGAMLSQPESDFRKTLNAMLSSVSELEDLLQSERDRLGRILGNVELVTASISTAVGEDGAVVSELLTGVSETLDHLNAEIESLAETNDQLSILLRKLNDGEGTLGLLINDASLYHRLDSTLTGLNNLMADFQNNPAKYLKEMKLVDLF